MSRVRKVLAMVTWCGKKQEVVGSNLITTTTYGWEIFRNSTPRFGYVSQEQVGETAADVMCTISLRQHRKLVDYAYRCVWLVHSCVYLLR